MIDSVAAQDTTIYDYTVPEPLDNPADTVSSIAWAPNSTMYMFACSDWDSKIRIYELVKTSGLSPKIIVQKGRFEVEEPCLCVNWGDDITKLYAGCIDNTVKLFDVMTGKSQNIGQHDAGIKSVHWIEQFNTLCSLSFDKTIKFWDPRQQTPAKVHFLGHKVYCSDLMFPNLLVGLSNERFLKLDLPNIDRLLTGDFSAQFIESPLGAGSQLTTVSFFTDGSGMGSTSHDGRANLSNFTTRFGGRTELSNIMTFRAHKNEDSTTLFHVHGIEFNPRAKNLVYTAGSEGIIYFWDYVQKSKITTLNFKKNPVTRMKTSPDGMFVAYALGYDWTRGVEGAHSVKCKIGAHEIQESELRYTRNN